MKLDIGTKITVVDYNAWIKHSGPNRELALAVQGGNESGYIIRSSEEGIIEMWFPNHTNLVAIRGLEYTLFCEDDIHNDFIEVEYSEETCDKVKAYLGSCLARAIKLKQTAENEIEKLVNSIGAIK